MKSKKVSKTESIQEFLARGGKVTIVPQGVGKEVKELVRQATGGPAVLLSMDDGSLYYGDKEKVKATAKPKASIDFSALPEGLKRKYLEMLNAQTQEERELDGEDDGEDDGEQVED